MSDHHPPTKKLKTSQSTMGDRKEEGKPTFLGVDTVAFIDDVLNCVDDYTCNHLDELERNIVEDCSLTEQHALELSKGIDNLYEELVRSIDRNMDKFEIFTLSAIFKPPPERRTMSTVSREQEAKLDVEIQALLEQFSGAQYAHRQLRKELRMKRAQTEMLHKTLASARVGDGLPDGVFLGVASEDTVERVQKVVESACLLVQRVDELDSLHHASPSVAPALANAPSKQSSSGYSTFVSDTQSANLSLAQASQLSDLMRNR